MSQPYKPASYNSVSPYLIVTDAAATIQFFVAVFGAVEIRRFADPASQRLMHAEVRLDDTVSADTLCGCRQSFARRGR